MPPLINNVELTDFFFGGPPSIAGKGLASNLNPFGKEIQRNYRYFVTIPPNSFFPSAIQGSMISDIGKMPLIRSWHVRSITIPQYSFKKESQYYGPVPRSFALLEHDGFEVSIEFEEDNYGTIGNLINWLQRCPIDSRTGNYRAPEAYQIPLMMVVSEDDNGVPIGIYSLSHSFYTNAQGPIFDYAQSDSIKYTVTFNTDIINSFFPKSWAIGSLRNLLPI